MSSRRDISIYFMAILVFLASTGLMVDHHYCQGQLEHSALMAKADSCHQKKSCDEPATDVEQSCCEKKDAQDQEEGCCSNESEYVQVDLDIPCLNTSQELNPLDQHILNPAAPEFSKKMVVIGAQYINDMPLPRLIDPHSLFQIFRC